MGRGKFNCNFTMEQEREMSEHIKERYIDNNISFDNTYLQIYALKKHNEWYSTSKIFKASCGWCTDFKRRWKISSVRPNKKRISDNYDPSENDKFLKDCLTELNRVGADNFWNMDETKWTTINMILSCFGKTGSDSTQISYSGNDKECITAIFCISAVGKFLDPYVIKKGTTARCLKSLKAPKNIKTCFTASGWVTLELMIIILDEIKKNSKGNDTVLVLDQYTVRTDEKFVEEAKKRNIKLIFVPVGQTGKFQPLDVGINGPLKSCARRLWKEERFNNFEEILDHHGDLGDLLVPKLCDAVRHLSDAIKCVIKRETVIKSFNTALKFKLEIKT